MTDPRKQAFLSYTWKLADLLGLKDWSFTIDEGIPVDSHDMIGTAGIQCHHGQMATVRFTEPFLDGAPEEQRLWLTHELLHCHFRRLDTFLSHTLDKRDKLYYDEHEEEIVHRLARLMAPQMPLPQNVRD